MLIEDVISNLAKHFNTHEPACKLEQVNVLRNSIKKVECVQVARDVNNPLHISNS